MATNFEEKSRHNSITGGLRTNPIFATLIGAGKASKCVRGICQSVISL